MSEWGVLVEHDSLPGQIPDRLTLTIAATSGPYYCLTCAEVILGSSVEHSGHNVKGLAAGSEDGQKMLALVDAALKLAAVLAGQEGKPVSPPEEPTG